MKKKKQVHFSVLLSFWDNNNHASASGGSLKSYHTFLRSQNYGRVCVWKRVNSLACLSIEMYWVNEKIGILSYNQIIDGVLEVRDRKLCVKLYVPTLSSQRVLFFQNVIICHCTKRVSVLGIFFSFVHKFHLAHSKFKYTYLAIEPLSIQIKLFHFDWVCHLELFYGWKRVLFVLNQYMFEKNW